MVPRHALLVLLAAALVHAAESPQVQLERWVLDKGGGIERNASGEPAAIDLSSWWVTDADLWRLAQVPSLRRIDLSGTRVSDAGLELLKDLPRVKELRLRFAEFVTAHGISHLRGWKELEVLDLRGTKVNSRVFEHLAKLESLRTLDISSTEVIDEGFEELVALTKLESLSCGANRLSGAALTALKPLRALRHLDVSGIQRVDSGLWGLALSGLNLERLGQLTQLESLSLRGATLADRGADRPGHELAKKQRVEGLEKLASLRGLQRLDLGGLPIESEDIRWITSLRDLRELSLDGAPGIDDRAIAIVARLRRLETLNLSHTDVSDQGLRQLRQVSSLKKIFLGGSQVTRAGVEGFRTARPECVVSWWGQEQTSAPNTQ